MNTGKAPIYPIEPWTVTEPAFSVEDNYRNETVFALSNGYIGTRGTFEEGYDFDIKQGLEGNFINGFYESVPIRYGEWNFGFPEKSQSLLNLPNAKTTQLSLYGELLDLRVGKIESYARILNLRDGILARSFVWTSPAGKKVAVETQRLVSFSRKNIMAARFSVRPLNFDNGISLLSILDGDVENHTRTTNPLVDYGPFGRRLELVDIHVDAERMRYTGITAGSRLSVCCGCLHVLDAPGAKDGSGTYATDYEDDDFFTAYKSDRTAQSASIRYVLPANPNETVVLDKFIAYTSSLDIPESEMALFIDEETSRAARDGWEMLVEEQRAYTQRFWESADIQIDGDDMVQQGLRFNLFHIMQGAGRDGYVGMGAKGLTGEGYEGHYFWDTEIYALPFFTFTFPSIAKSLLEYRRSTLEEARARARELGHPKGAMYPWRTINGREASTYLPLGTAQYHINADVAYAFWQYLSASGDQDYAKAGAAEVLCETARVWADVGCFSEARDGKYCICCVTGPDEYTAFVDNNFYTNLMARENLKAAVHTLERLKADAPKAYKALRAKIGLEEEEPVQWQHIADNMYLPYDEKDGVYLQDDGMLMRKPWDDSRIPPEKRHLLYENYHPLYVWRQRMAKQADSILAMYLHSHLFSKEELRRNYDYYQKITLHHSSLSTCIFGILACGIGYRDEALRYFYESVRMDLDDYHENVYAGIHAANMAGAWQAVTSGFGGFRWGNGLPEFDPFLPDGWQGYTFRVFWRHSLLEISVRRGLASVRLVEGPPVTLLLCGQSCRLERPGEEARQSIV